MHSMLLALGALAMCASALPSATSTAAPSPEATHISLPIYTNKRALHPRNKNVGNDTLAAWMARERGHLQRKYKKKNRKNSKKEARQMAGLGDVGPDTFYFSQIGVGSPSTTFNVVLDTGSSDFWVADSSCSSCAGLTQFDASKSSTYKGSGQNFQVPYGSGAVAGTLGADDVTMAGYKVAGLTLGQAKQLAQGTIQSPVSGLMGMGFESLSSSGSSPFWEVVAIQGKVKDPVFSFQLATNAEHAKSAKDINPGGVFTLGNLDDQQFSGDIAWVKLASRFGSQGMGYWGIKMDAMQVNGNNVNLGSDNLVAVDTGTTLIGAPSNVIQAIYEQIPNARSAPSSMLGGEGYYLFPCTQPFTVSFTFGGKQFQLDNEQLNIGMVSQSGSYCASALFDAGIDARSGMPTWILGDTFLRTVYTAFMWNPEQVGFASLPKGGVQTLSMTSVSTAKSASATRSAAAGGGGIPGGLSSRTVNTRQTGLLGGAGLPKPSLVSVPSGMQTLSAYGLGGNSGQLSARAVSSLRLVLLSALLATLVASICL